MLDFEEWHVNKYGYRSADCKNRKECNKAWDEFRRNYQDDMCPICAKPVRNVDCTACAPSQQPGG